MFSDWNLQKKKKRVIFNELENFKNWLACYMDTILVIFADIDFKIIISCYLYI